MRFFTGTEAKDLLKSVTEEGVVARARRIIPGIGISVTTYLGTSLETALSVRSTETDQPIVIATTGSSREVIQYFNDRGGEWLTDMVLDLSDDEMAALTKVAMMLVEGTDFDRLMTADIADALIAFNIESNTPQELSDALARDERAGLFFRELVNQAITSAFANLA